MVWVGPNLKIADVSGLGKARTLASLDFFGPVLHQPLFVSVAVVIVRFMLVSPAWVYPDVGP